MYSFVKKQQILVIKSTNQCLFVDPKLRVNNFEFSDWNFRIFLNFLKFLEFWHIWNFKIVGIFRIKQLKFCLPLDQTSHSHHILACLTDLGQVSKCPLKWQWPDKQHIVFLYGLISPVFQVSYWKWLWLRKSFAQGIQASTSFTRLDSRF